MYSGTVAVYCKVLTPEFVHGMRISQKKTLRFMKKVLPKKEWL